MQGFFLRNRWWVSRVALAPLQLLVFSLVVFVLVRTIPGDPIELVTGGQYTPASYAAVQHDMGLDGSIGEQLVRHFAKLVNFDLGQSLISSRSIWEDLAQKLPATLELALMALTGILTVTLFCSYMVVIRPANPSSHVFAAYARTAGAIPEFALGIVAIFVFYATLRWVPAPLGRLSPFVDQPPPVTHLPFLDTMISGNVATIQSMAAHLILPVLVMTLAHSPALMKVLIADLEAAVEATPTKFRIASGASHWVVLLSVYRRALPPAVTMIGNLFGQLLGGAMVVESLFGFDGLGKYAVEAVMTSDLTAVQGVIIVVAALILLVQLLVDVANMLLDPRRRPGIQQEL